jgi:hypothetical protein
MKNGIRNGRFGGAGEMIKLLGDALALPCSRRRRGAKPTACRTTFMAAGFPAMCLCRVATIAWFDEAE